MGMGGAVDTAIGLILMYLVLGLLCTVVNEAIATVFGTRANNLKKSLEKIIDDSHLIEKFWNHGIIAGGNASIKSKKMSYIHGQVFSSALLGSLDPTKDFPIFSDLEEAIKKLPASHIRDVLTSQVSISKNDLEKLRNGVAAWFDRTMERISGDYKRRMQLQSLGIGLVVAIAFNADSFFVANTLWNDATVRTELVQTAQNIVKPGASISSSPGVLLREAGEQNPLPIGWHSTTSFHGSISLLSTLGGWIFTAFALSLGAPFWFDLLSKFINLRGTGPKPRAS